MYDKQAARHHLAHPPSSRAGLPQPESPAGMLMPLPPIQLLPCPHNALTKPSPQTKRAPCPLTYRAASSSPSPSTLACGCSWLAPTPHPTLPATQQRAASHLQGCLVEFLIQHTDARLQLASPLQHHSAGQAGQGDGEQPVLVQHLINQLQGQGKKAKRKESSRAREGKHQRQVGRWRTDGRAQPTSSSGQQ